MNSIQSRVVSRGMPLESPHLASVFSYLKFFKHEVNVIQVNELQNNIVPPSQTVNVYTSFEGFIASNAETIGLSSHIKMVSDLVEYASLKPRKELWAVTKAQSLKAKLGIVDNEQDLRRVCDELESACIALSTKLNGNRLFSGLEKFSCLDIQFMGVALIAHYCLDKSTSRVKAIISRHMNLDALLGRFCQFLERPVNYHLDNETIKRMVDDSHRLDLGSQTLSSRPSIRFVHSDGRDCVLKGFVPGSVEFMRELSLLQDMRFERVVQMYGFGSYEFGRFNNWIVLKYYPQGNLEEYLRALPNFKDCLSILEQVAFGTYQVQTHAYPPNVHCDLKPYNIYMEENNAFIGDFGGCCAEGDKQGSGGSMVYCESRRPVVRHQDVCSVGVIILRALALPHLFFDNNGLTLSQWRERIEDVLASSSIPLYSLSLFREEIKAECPDVFATELLCLVNNCIKLPFEDRPDIYSVAKQLQDIRMRLNFCDALPEDF